MVEALEETREILFRIGSKVIHVIEPLVREEAGD
jgi:hypothetical protein